jgi:Nitrogen regulatory protein PII
MTVSDVKGFGRQRGQDGGLNTSPDYDDEFRVKIKIELIIEDKIVEKALEAIKNGAYSGKIGDGKIFISTIDQVIRIRTGEKDSDAV